MKISVIIPTYKPQDYLWECLNSICSQTLPKEDYEVILVLNGCNEPFNIQIKQYIANHLDVNWNYIQTNEGGVSNARNIALDAVTGEFLTFIDDDDYVSPTFFESLVAKANDETIVLSNVYAFDDGSPEIQRKYRISDSYHHLKEKGRVYFPKARKFFSGPCMKLIPSCFIKDRYFDTQFKVGEDSLYMYYISDNYKYVDFASEDAVYYRRYRTGSAITTSRHRIDIVKNELRLLFAMLKIYIPRFWKYNLLFSLQNFLSTIHGMLIS